MYCYWLSSLTQVPRETNYSNPKSMQNGFERLLSMVRNVLFSPILVSLITTHNMLKWNSFKFENLANNWLQQRIGLYHLERAKLGKKEWKCNISNFSNLSNNQNCSVCWWMFEEGDFKAVEPVQTVYLYSCKSTRKYSLISMFTLGNKSSTHRWCISI